MKGQLLLLGPFWQMQSDVGVLGAYPYTTRIWRSSQFAKYMPSPHLLNILNKDFKENANQKPWG